jgi:hypothetical protein
MRRRGRPMSTGLYVWRKTSRRENEDADRFVFWTDNLRYAFSSCVYNFPTSVTNISTPCLVSCTPLGPALEFQLTNPTGSSLNTFCGSSAFADNDVSTCEFCYSLTSQQAYLSNRTSPSFLAYLPAMSTSSNKQCHYI